MGNFPNLYLFEYNNTIYYNLKPYKFYLSFHPYLKINIYIYNFFPFYKKMLKFTFVFLNLWTNKYYFLKRKIHWYTTVYISQQKKTSCLKKIAKKFVNTALKTFYRYIRVRHFIVQTTKKCNRFPNK